MRRSTQGLLFLGSLGLLAVLGYRMAEPSGAVEPKTAGVSPTTAPHPVVAGESSRPRISVLAINGGGAPQQNYQSHLSHLNELLAILRGVGVPPERITVLAGDGSDPTADIVVREAGVGPESWRLRGTAVEKHFGPVAVMGNSAVAGATLFPATHGSLSIWMMTVGQQLRAGDVLLLYVTDHGTRGERPDDNRIVLWGDGQGLSVRELRQALETLDPSVRIVAFMSQCYSGAFASLLDLGGAAGRPTGRFCGFFSTTADRPSYGCYVETRDDPKVGHSFAFLQALPAAAGRFSLAHELALELDDTPDVPLRTSDLHVAAVLSGAAAARGVPVARLVDEILERAWGEEPGWNLDVQRLDRLAAQFGLPPIRRRAAAAHDLETLSKTLAPLERFADQIDGVLARLNRSALQRLLAARSAWRVTLEPSHLEALDPASRLRLGSSLASDLAAFSRAEGDEQARVAQQEREAVKQLIFRVRVRMAALARIEVMLDAFAGWQYLADRPTERELAQRLVDCEALDLALPKAEWVDPGPALPAWADELALTRTMLAMAEASAALRGPAVRPGQPVPELELVAFRGQVPKLGAGKPLLLFFWATWCKPCKEVLPDLMALARQSDLEVLAISDESEANLERFFERFVAVARDFPRLVARDPGHHVQRHFGVHAFPSFVLLDREGKVASPVTSYLRELATALGGAPPRTSGAEQN